MVVAKLLMSLVIAVLGAELKEERLVCLIVAASDDRDEVLTSLILSVVFSLVATDVIGFNDVTLAVALLLESTGFSADDKLRLRC